MVGKPTITLVIAVLIATTIAAASLYTSSEATGVNSEEMRNIMEAVYNSLNISNVYHHIRSLSSFKSRVTGYDGYYNATNYIITEFRSMGLKVTVQEYKVVVPVDYGASIRVVTPEGVVTKEFEAYALWPNLVQTCSTPPEGLSGKLVYVGKGRDFEIEGKELSGSIVLMDFNSGDRWLRIAELGAKAVIFIEEPDMLRMQALMKVVPHPLYFPRLYVDGVVGEELRRLSSEGGYRVIVTSTVRYELKKVYNVIAEIEGTQSPNEIVVISAYYDSWSVVPKLSPGADEASGIAALLEIARLLKTSKPLRTIWLVALSGHWQALAGAREFVENYYFHYVNRSRYILLQVNLDLSTGSDILSIQYASYFYQYGGERCYPRYSKWLVPALMSKYVPLIKEVMGVENLVPRYLRNGILSEGWTADIPISYIIDSEPLSMAGGIGITLLTAKDYRFIEGTPLDTYDRLDLKNLEPQVTISSLLAACLANDPEVTIDYGEISPKRLYVAWGAGAGFVTLSGYVLEYNASKAWYDEVPNALVYVVDSTRLADIFSYMFTFSDTRGRFEIHGLAAVSAWQWGGAAARRYLVEAWIVNFSDGRVVYAPDRGPYAWTYDVVTDRHPTPAYPVVFRCEASYTISSVIDPDSLSSTAFLDRSYQQISIVRTPVTVQILDFDTYNPFLSYGLELYQPSGLLTVFLPLKGVKILVRLDKTTGILGFLVNATPEQPEGLGLSVTSPINLLTYPYLRFASDMFYVAESRYKALSTYMVHDLIVEKYLSLSEKYLKLAMECHQRREHVKSRAMALLAYGYASKAYRETMRLIYDSQNTVLFINALIIPFAIISERVLLEARGARRLLSVLFLALLLNGVLYFIHPAFHLAVNAYVLVLALTALIFTLFVYYAITNIFAESLRAMKIRLLGYHFFSAEVTSSIEELFSAITIGVGNIKKRKLRSALTCIAVTLQVFALTSLTSVPPIVYINPVEITPVGKTYSGVLLRYGNMAQEEYLSTDIISCIKHLFPSGLVTYRVIWYAPLVAEGTYMTEITSPRGALTVPAFLGLPPEESYFTLKRALLMGRTFMEGDYYAVILTNEQAKLLNVTIGDQVTWSGLNLTVVGIVDSVVLSTVLDLDQRGVPPNDPARMNPPPGSSVVPEYVPLSWDRVLIVPAQFALDIGGYVGSVAASPQKGNIETYVEELALLLSQSGFDITFSSGKGILAYRNIRWFAAKGWEAVMVPAILGLMVVLMTMLGAVYERVGEIRIYEALGGSPRSIASMFLVESTIYAIIGGVIGYIMGVLGGLALYRLGVISVEQGFIPNYYSFTVILTALFALGVTILSSIYPSFKAGRLVTPSLLRRWRFPTAPRGDYWDIPLPFNVTREEVVGVLQYVLEFLGMYGKSRELEFYVEEAGIIKKEEEMGLRAVVGLAPYEAGIKQEVLLWAFPISKDRYSFRVRLHRLQGIYDIWVSSNRSFVDKLRKQLLLWRSLPWDQKIKYIEVSRVEKSSSSSRR